MIFKIFFFPTHFLHDTVKSNQTKRFIVFLDIPELEYNMNLKIVALTPRGLIYGINSPTLIPTKSHFNY